MAGMLMPPAGRGGAFAADQLNVVVAIVVVGGGGGGFSEGGSTHRRNERGSTRSPVFEGLFTAGTTVTGDSRPGTGNDEVSQGTAVKLRNSVVLQTVDSSHFSKPPMQRPQWANAKTSRNPH